jgi:hypothetical protein
MPGGAKNALKSTTYKLLGEMLGGLQNALKSTTNEFQKKCRSV